MGTSRNNRLTAESLPDLLTVEEAAALLRIGRNKAYDLTRHWRATNGRVGLPVIDFDGVLRVPRHALERLIGAELLGPLPATPAPKRPVSARPAASEAGEPGTAHDPADVVAPSNVTPIRRLRRSVSADQLSLFQPPTTQASEGP